ncbi:hypothetical protein HMPREF0645_1460 [Hallella bergensis DSM 17361]|uniref:Uncharacterized protein n=1 Tax=Hallella bergensis DSM 17361 TaxID=585502 RepID=D1PWX5_9BACT|nr:hypothetical protein HMPREF0645_1460 [Hallella bergensis DSM 17361]
MEERRMENKEYKLKGKWRTESHIFLFSILLYSYMVIRIEEMYNAKKMSVEPLSPQYISTASLPPTK